MSPTKEASSLPPPRLTRIAGARRMLGDCSRDVVYELIHAGEIESFLDGKVRKIVIASVDDYIARRIKSGVKQFRRHPNLFRGPPHHGGELGKGQEAAKTT